MKIGFLAVLFAALVPLTSCNNNQDKLGTIVAELKTQKDSRQLAFHLNRIKNKEIGINDLFQGRSALEHAAELGEYETVALLLEMGADPNVKSNESNNGKVPLMTAIHKKYNEITKLLLEKGADVNVKDNDGMAVIHYTGLGYIDPASYDIVISMINRGADCNTKDIEGNSLLQKIHPYESPLALPLAELLVQKGADVNVATANGCTILHILAQTPSDNTNISPDPGVELFKLLLQNGADINAKLKDGRSVKDMANRFRNNPGILNLIENKK